MIRVLIVAGLATALVGCGNTSDVSANDVKSKEQMIDQQTAKLNGGKASPGQQGDQ